MAFAIINFKLSSRDCYYRPRANYYLKHTSITQQQSMTATTLVMTIHSLVSYFECPRLQGLWFHLILFSFSAHCLFSVGHKFFSTALNFFLLAIHFTLYFGFGESERYAPLQSFPIINIDGPSLSSSVLSAEYLAPSPADWFC